MYLVYYCMLCTIMFEIYYLFSYIVSYSYIAKPVRVI